MIERLVKNCGTADKKICCTTKCFTHQISNERMEYFVLESMVKKRITQEYIKRIEKE